MTTQTQYTVASTVKDAPDLFRDWDVVTFTEHFTNGNAYQIVTMSKVGIRANSIQYLDLICDRDFNYISLGSEKSQRTFETVELISLIAESNRLFP